MSQEAVESLALRAVQCRKCFEDGRLKSPTIDCAQPRWIGPGYWKSNPRVLVMMINPGRGSSRMDGANQKMRELLHQFGGGTVQLEEIFARQRRDMANWGKRRFTFTDFYEKGMGLNLDELAFANIAWCATRSEKYPSYMLRNCFSSFTKSLVEILAPNLILLSGNAAHRFDRALNAVLPNTQILRILHYAHRKGKDASCAEFLRVRDEYANLLGQLQYSAAS